MAIVKIIWQDTIEYEDMDEMENREPEICTSYGELLDMNQRKIVLIRERRGHECDIQVFPRGCVEKIVYLNEAEPGLEELFG